MEHVRQNSGWKSTCVLVSGWVDIVYVCNEDLCKCAGKGAASIHSYMYMLHVHEIKTRPNSYR